MWIEKNKLLPGQCLKASSFFPTQNLKDSFRCKYLRGISCCNSLMISLTASFLSWEPVVSECFPRCITLSTITSNTSGSSKNFWFMSSKCLLSRAIPRATLGFPPERTFPYSAIHSFTSLYLGLVKVSSICWPMILSPLCPPLNSKHGRYTPSSFCKTLAMMPNSKLFNPFFTNTKLRSLSAAQLCFNPTPFSPIESDPEFALAEMNNCNTSFRGAISFALFRIHRPVV
mmetsp:Transcript_25671/g.46493  ORF Transcript_25671/g.46493 Transcript_25671/m.46493 type:complete len:229 (+) Transcript_25671:342-1028(+)